MRYFNTTGPVVSEEHYNILALSRWGMDGIRQLIREKRYFVLHAPRQTGKTSCLLALMKKLNEEGNYTALYAIPPEQLTLQVTTYLPPTPFLEKEKKTAVAMR